MLRHQTLLPDQGILLVLAAAAVLNASCASAPPADTAAPAAQNNTAAEAAPTGPQTVTEALGDLPEDGTVLADAGPVLNPGAPKSYVVQRGDTLWGLSRMFLRDPWLWPEIWYVNPQVQNPHLIYPGDTLQLATGRDGHTTLQITRGPAARLQPLLRSSQMADGAIATIPYEAIRAFLTRPSIISSRDAKAAPYVFAIRDGHIMAGNNDEIYLKKFKGAVGEHYSVLHIDVPLNDPDGGGNLGYMAIYAGNGVIKRAGDDATATITEVAREVLTGDVLVSPVTENLQNIVPHKPAKNLTGRVIAISNGISLAGQYQVIALNRGTEHGVEVGHVLRAQEATQRARDTCAHLNGKPTCRSLRDVPLPIEDAGTLLVFRSFEHMSYALIVEENNPIRVGDLVGNP